MRTTEPIPFHEPGRGWVIYPAGTPVEFVGLKSVRDRSERGALDSILRRDADDNPALVKLGGRYRVIPRRLITQETAKHGSNKNPKTRQQEGRRVGQLF